MWSNTLSTSISSGVNSSAQNASPISSATKLLMSPAVKSSVLSSKGKSFKIFHSSGSLLNSLNKSWYASGDKNGVETPGCDVETPGGDVETSGCEDCVETSGGGDVETPGGDVETSGCEDCMETSGGGDVETPGGDVETSGSEDCVIGSDNNGIFNTICVCACGDSKCLRFFEV